MAYFNYTVKRLFSTTKRQQLSGGIDHVTEGNIYLIVDLGKRHPT